MRAIIEIPDELIRRAGSAIGQKHPKFVDVIITAIGRLAKTEEMTIRFPDKASKDSIEADVALMCVTQVMEDIADEIS